MSDLVRWAISLLAGLVFVIVVWNLARAYDEYEAKRDYREDDDI